MNKIVFIFLFFFPFSLLSQEWENHILSEEHTGATEIHTEAFGDEIHVLYKFGSNQMYYCYSPDHGKTWQKQNMLNIQHRTFEVGELSSAIDSQGVYHIAFFQQNTNHLFHMIKTSQGWETDTILWGGPSADGWHRIFLEIDGKGRLHAVFKDYTTVIYLVNEGNEWVTGIVPSPAKGTFQEYTACMNRKGTFYLLRNTPAGELYLQSTSDLGENWTTELIGNYKAGKELSMSADSEGNPHICYSKNYSFKRDTLLPTYHYLHKNSSGKWEEQNLYKTFAVTGSSLRAYYPSIFVDSKDGIHITYIPSKTTQTNFPKDTIIPYWYKDKDSSAFKKTPLFCPSLGNPGTHIQAVNGHIYIGYISGTKKWVNNRWNYQKAIGLYTRVFKIEEDPVKNPLQERVTEEQAVVNVQSTSPILEIWDNEKEDGDIVSVWLNNQLILDQYMLVNAHKKIPLTLESGKNYMLTFYSISEGKYSPCTGTIRIIDGTKSSSVTITSNSGKNGAVKLTVK